MGQIMVHLPFKMKYGSWKLQISPISKEVWQMEASISIHTQEVWQMEARSPPFSQEVWQMEAA